MSLVKGRLRRWMFACGLLAALAVAFAADAGRILVVDAPERSDVILVLAGETDHRPARGLQLFDQGYGRSVVLDVPAGVEIFGFDEVQLAKKYSEDRPDASVRVCAIVGLSTRDESRDAARCLAGMQGTSSFDCHLRLPHAPRAQHFPPRSSWEDVLDRCFA